MAIKEVAFSFPARYALRTFLNRPHVNLNIEAIVNGQEFYEKLNLGRLQDWVERNSDKKGAVQYSKLFGKETECITADIDESYLTWLRGALKAHDWSAVWLPDGRQITAGVPAELRACIAFLWRAVNEAISS